MAERKKFNDVEIPLLGSSIRVLGSEEELNNKTLKLDLARRMKGKGLTITFRIIKDGKELVAIPNRMELVKSYIRRMMRKRTDYVEDSFVARCSDVSLSIKPFLITRKKVSRAIRKNLRNTAKSFLIEYVKDKEYNVLCEELRNGSLQKAMLPKLKKVYPLSFCDLRVFETRELSKVDVKKIIENAKREQKEQVSQEVDQAIEQDPLEDAQVGQKKEE